MAAHPQPWQRRMRLAGWTVLVLLALGLAATVVKMRNDILSSSGEHRPLEPGLSYAVADTHITEILFSAADLKLYAYRWGPEHPFHIAVLRPSQDALEICVGGRTFEEWFQMTTEMYVGAPLDEPVAVAPGDWAVFELIAYQSVVERNDTRLLLPTRPGEPIIAEWDHIPGQYPVEWDPEFFALVTAGCAGLAARPAGSAG